MPNAEPLRNEGDGLHGSMEEGYGLQPVQKGSNKNRGLQPPRAAIEVTCSSPGIHPRHKSNACAAVLSPRGTRREAGVSTPANPAANPQGLKPRKQASRRSAPPQPRLRSVFTPAHPPSRQSLVTGHGFSHAECRAFLRNEGDGLHGSMEEGYGLHGRRVRASARTKRPQ